MPKPMLSALEQIGNTPLVELSRLYKGPGRVFAKAEYIQPGGSVKDRAALQILKDAYADGRLKKGMPVVEMTSGNMGSGLAVVCAILGNPFVAVMSEGNSPERVKMLKGLGAEVVLVKQVDGVPGKVTGADVEEAFVIARQITEERRGFFADQFNNTSSIKAHFSGTGPEIFTDLDGRVDAFIASVGSGGTFLGVAKYLKSQRPSIHTAVVEALGNEVLLGNPVTKPQHMLQGTGYCRPPHWDGKFCDSYWTVTDEEAIEYRELIAKTEGLYVGYSAAANVCGAIKLLKSGKLGNDANVVTVLCDTGLKYG